MPPEPPPDPERLDSYLICATPRTGSSLLCGLLDSTGVAGHPESWFRRQDEREFAARWGIADPSNGTFGYAGYFQAAVAAGSTANDAEFVEADVACGTRSARSPGRRVADVLVSALALPRSPEKSGGLGKRVVQVAWVLPRPAKAAGTVLLGCPRVSRTQPGVCPRCGR